MSLSNNLIAQEKIQSSFNSSPFSNSSPNGYNSILYLAPQFDIKSNEEAFIPINDSSTTFHSIIDNSIEHDYEIKSNLIESRRHSTPIPLFNDEALIQATNKTKNNKRWSLKEENLIRLENYIFFHNNQMVNKHLGCWNYMHEKSKGNEKNKKLIIYREGDWTCLKCKNVNFSFRTICNMCSSNKENY